MLWGLREPQAICSAWLFVFASQNSCTSPQAISDGNSMKHRYHGPGSRTALLASSDNSGRLGPALEQHGLCMHPTSRRTHPVSSMIRRTAAAV